MEEIEAPEIVEASAFFLGVPFFFCLLFSRQKASLYVETTAAAMLCYYFPHGTAGSTPSVSTGSSVRG